MKAWIVRDKQHGTLDIIHAETRSRARLHYAHAWNAPLEDVFKGHSITARRAPACDDIEAWTDSLKLIALKAGYVDWLQLGCHCTIEAHEADDVVLGMAGHTWCCKAHREGLPGGAKGCRHGNCGY